VTLPPIDPDKPSAARVYDHLLGGEHNFAVDRELAARMIEVEPDTPAIVRATRAFLQRAVRFAATEGIAQFLDLGSGIPTVGNVHEVARDVRPRARVAYVDIDPAAVLHARTILGDDPDTVVLRADLCDVAAILGHPAFGRLFDLAEPLCVLLVGVLHQVTDSARLADVLASYRNAAAPGSLLVMSHGTATTTPDRARRVITLYQRGGTLLTARTDAEVLALLGDWPPVPPGLVYTGQWRPDAETPQLSGTAARTNHAVVARKG
jgi:hypothetical protein